MSESWYDRHILPHLIDLACGMKPVRQQREKIVPRARGVTGANFRANCFALGRGGADKFGEVRDLGAGQAQART